MIRMNLLKREERMKEDESHETGRSDLSDEMN